MELKWDPVYKDLFGDAWHIASGQEIIAIIF